MKTTAYRLTFGFFLWALIPILIMTIGRTAFSWSQNHLNKFDFLLYAALFGISMVFMLRGLFHPRKDDRIFKIFWDVSQGQWNIFVSIMFACVMFFGVNSEIKLISNLHMVFTAIAIVSGHISMLFYPKTDIGFHGAILGSSVGLVGFIFMYLFPFFTTAEAELWTAFPLIVWLIGSTKKE